MRNSISRPVWTASFRKELTDYLHRILDIIRDEKYRMSAQELATHHGYLEDCFLLLYERIGRGSLSFVRDNTNLRLFRFP